MDATIRVFLLCVLQVLSITALHNVRFQQRTGPDGDSANAICKNVICSRGTRCIMKDTQCEVESCPVFAVCEELKTRLEMCELPPRKGNCPYSYKQWYYDGQTMECKEFTFSGCDGNANNYGSKIRCEQSCVRRDKFCVLKPETGPCRASMPRWYYETATGTCGKFIYGGCQGNENNFKSRQSCMATCGTLNEQTRPSTVT